MKRRPEVGDRVELTGTAKWRHMSYRLREGLTGTIEDITGTRYVFSEKYPKVGFAVPFQKRYWIRLDTPTRAMRNEGSEVIGMWNDEFRLLEVV